MPVDYSPEIRLEANERSLLQSASALLGDILGKSRQLVNAKWDSVQDGQGQRRYRLTIRDTASEVSTDFTLDELQNHLHMKVRLYRLWGDLLEVRNNQQHEQVQFFSGQLPTV